MSATIQIDGRTIGAGHPAWVCAELGINANGSMDNARAMIDVAAAAGCDAVKTQKRTIDVVYTAADLAQSRPGPWGETNGDLKRLLEFSPEQCRELAAHASALDLAWSASPWDLDSVQVLADLGVSWIKIASASITDLELVGEACSIGCPVIMSTGMSTAAEIDAAVEVATGRAPSLALLHTCSAYPSPDADLHLSRMEWLRDRYGVVVGYSGHESGVTTSVEAARLGASIIERHVTLDRTMWGSDQAASLEPPGLRILVRAIRWLESRSAEEREDPALSADAVLLAEVDEVVGKAARNRRLNAEAHGTPGPREVLPSEVGPRTKLRKR